VLTHPIFTHLVVLLIGAIGGALIYRKNRARVERVRAQAEVLGDAFHKK